MAFRSRGLLRRRIGLRVSSWLSVSPSEIPGKAQDLPQRTQRRHRGHGVRLDTHRTLLKITQGRETQRITEQILNSVNDGVLAIVY